MQRMKLGLISDIDEHVEYLCIALDRTPGRRPGLAEAVRQSSVVSGDGASGNFPRLRLRTLAWS